MMKSYVLTLLMLITACDLKDKLENPAVQAPTDNSLPSETNIEIPKGMALATPRITAMAYKVISHSLSLSIEYGGCAATSHQLLLNACAESYPMRCQAQLIRPKSFDGSCKMLIRDDLELPLEKDLDMAYVILKSSDGTTKSVLVDKTGKGAPIPPGEGDGGATLVASDATITALSYDAASHALTLELDYKGCTVAQHGLDFNSICTLSFPEGCSAQLVRVADYDKSCDENQHETMIYPLTEEQDTMMLFVSNTDKKGLRVLIDHYGKVKNPLP